MRTTITHSHRSNSKNIKQRISHHIVLSANGPYLVFSFFLEQYIYISENSLPSQQFETYNVEFTYSLVDYIQTGLKVAVQNILGSSELLGKTKQAKCYRSYILFKKSNKANNLMHFLLLLYLNATIYIFCG